MEITPQALFQQNIDKQRILVTGANRSKLAGMIASILNFGGRKFDHFSDGQLKTMADAPIIIIESTVNSHLPDYQHHVLLLTNFAESELPEITNLLNATPKSGIIIYPEENQKLKSMVGKERVDTQILPYKMIPHEVKNGQTILISSTNDKFPIHLQGSETLLLLAAAKELVRKIGISSGQFYKAVAVLE